MANDSNAGGVAWFQDGPTTHVTTDGETSVCGHSDVPDHVDTHPVDSAAELDELNLCGRCDNALAGDIWADANDADRRLFER